MERIAFVEMNRLRRAVWAFEGEFREVEVDKFGFKHTDINWAVVISSLSVCGCVLKHKIVECRDRDQNLADSIDAGQALGAD